MRLLQNAKHRHTHTRTHTHLEARDSPLVPMFVHMHMQNTFDGSLFDIRKELRVFSFFRRDEGVPRRACHRSFLQFQADDDRVGHAIDPAPRENKPGGARRIGTAVGQGRRCFLRINPSDTARDTHTPGEEIGIFPLMGVTHSRHQQRQTALVPHVRMRCDNSTHHNTRTRQQLAESDHVSRISTRTAVASKQRNSQTSSL